jgi:CubicO group peptidase (beta-lactamase class C family)
MHDSYYVLPPALRERRVYREPGMPGTQPAPMHSGIDSHDFDELGTGGGTVASTARDLAAFLQMFLNQGSYRGVQILSRASVDAMTRVQFDKTVTSVFPWTDKSTGQRTHIEIRGGGFGYGFYVFGENDRLPPNGSLMSLTAFGHLGGGGACFWADPERELVGVYLSVSPRAYRGIYLMNSDLFQNAVHAAIVD